MLLLSFVEAAVAAEPVVAPDAWVLGAGGVIPVIVAAAFRPGASDRARTLFAVGLCVAVGLVQALTDSGGDAAAAVSAFAAAMVAQLSSYKVLTGGLGLDLNERTLPGIGLGSASQPEDD